MSSDRKQENLVVIDHPVNIEPWELEEVKPIELYATKPAAIETYTPTGNKGVDEVKKAIDVTKACLDLGQFAYKNVKENLQVIGGVGVLVKALLAFIPDEKKPDPVLEKLKDLGKQIDQLADKMNAKFDDLKAFLTELNFFMEVMSPTFKLTQYMQDCINHPSEQTMQNLRNSYNKHSPLDLAYTVLFLMEQKSTNPLKMSMEADALKSKHTFNKWYNILDGVLAQFLFIETFASGLLNNGSMDNTDRLNDKAEPFLDSLDKLREQYRNDDSYWSSLKKHVSIFLDDNKSLSNSKKADKIQEMLDSILTTDAFYVTVFDHWTKDWVNYSSYVENDDQFMKLFGYGNGNTFIYRSKKANFVSEDTLKQMRSTVKSGFDFGTFLNNRETSPKQLIKNYKDAGFICIIGYLGEETRSANCPKNEGEPGWWTTHGCTYNRQNFFRRIIVGYK